MTSPQEQAGRSAYGHSEIIGRSTVWRQIMTQAGIETLLHYDWPGNIRELCNVIQRAAIFAQGGALEFDLPMRKATAASTSPRSDSGDGGNAEYLTEAEVRRRERENLFIVLQKTDWIKGVDGAAELLGIKPTTLMSRIEKLGLRRPPSPSGLATPGFRQYQDLGQ